MELQVVGSYCLCIGSARRGSSLVRGGGRAVPAARRLAFCCAAAKAAEIRRKNCRRRVRAVTNACGLLLYTKAKAQ